MINENYICFFLSIILISQASKADEYKSKVFVDMYRSNQTTADTIYEQLKPEFHRIANLMQSKESIYSKANKNKIERLMEKIHSVISQSGKYALINISPVIYPGSKVTYFTVDLVDEADKQRLDYFLKKPDQSFEDPHHLISAWRKYESIGLEMMMKEKIVPKYKICPAFHCIFGFDHIKLKKYQAIFDTYVPKDKMQLIQILRNEKDNQKRAAAAYLLAHLKDGKEIIQILIPSIRDADAGVRNNAMRVIAETILRLKDPDFPIQEAVDALDFPMTVDRNKALFMLLPLVEQPRYAEYLAKHAGKQLIEELKMNQNNVHELSYNILKIISGKNYAERDYQSWEGWVKERR